MVAMGTEHNKMVRRWWMDKYKPGAKQAEWKEMEAALQALNFERNHYII